MSTIGTIDWILGSVASIGLLYLLYSEIMVVHYRRFFRLITLGLLIYAVSGPIIGRFVPALIHFIHGIATLFIAIGLYDLIREDLRRELDLSALLEDESADMDAEFGFEEGA